jgi:hypothetical protein
VRGNRAINLAPSPLTRFARIRPQIDLSRPAGRGIIKLVLARGGAGGKRRKRVETAE